MKKIVILICTLFLLSGCGQKTPEINTTDTTATDSNVIDMKAIGTSDGQSYVVYWSEVDAPKNLELRLQLIDADGNQKLGNNGVLVSDQIPMNTYTSLWDLKIDSEDNIYIGVTGTGDDNPAYVFKMNLKGEHVWDVEKAHIGNGDKVTILPLSDGGILVGWLESEDSMMQRFDKSGNTLWPEPKLMVPDTGSAAPNSFFELSDGGFIALMHQMNGVDSHLYAQRYDADGNEKWDTAVQLSNGITAWNRMYKGIQDGDVVYVGYHAYFGRGFDSFLQRINPDGTLPWGINGSAFSTDPDYLKMETAIAFEPESDHIWALSTYRTTSQGDVGEYVQKFNKETGERLLSDNAKEVFAVGDDKIQLSTMWLEKGSPLFMIYNGLYNETSDISLKIVALDENGSFLWKEKTRTIDSNQTPKNRMHFLKPINDQYVVVFIEDQGNGERTQVRKLAN